MPKEWIIASPWPGRADAAQQLGVPPLISQLLYNRGIVETEQARTFLNPDLKLLHDPHLLTGTQKAAQIIAEKIQQNKKMVVYGDYDVDGITATSILWHLLTLAGADVSFYIPHRLEEGYGLNAEALHQLHSQGADTIITVDCGITAQDEAQTARQIGLTLIVTDHHALAETMPDADAVVHPALDQNYPNPNLCGAGVAFKLAWAVAKNLSNAQRVNPQFRQFLIDAVGLVALGTIADIVPLTGENRILTRFGLSSLADSKLVGLKALIESARLNNTKINSEHVGYWLAPRLNAAGRMGHAQLAVELLTRANQERAKEIALYLEEQNRNRKTLENRIFKEACERIDCENLASDSQRAIVLASTGWHAGVIGIVASRIIDRYHRPTVMIALEDGEGQGSARSIRHFELHKTLADCSQHLIAHGGHAMAAGLRIKQENIEPFTQAFIQRANNLLTGKDLEPVLRLDAEVPLAELTEPVVKLIHRLAPFGTSNPKPKFASAELQLDGEPRTVGRSGEHLQFGLTDGKVRRKAIAFGKKDRLQELLDHRRCRVAFVPILNTFNGKTSVELQVIDFVFP
ncbi:MAG: single-stranded-DNA-specific exonuclease RecJ [Planctomycetota bacterium]|jgi:single-stranded-DNA-specific exonuclease